MVKAPKNFRNSPENKVNEVPCTTYLRLGCGRRVQTQQNICLQLSNNASMAASITSAIKPSS